MKLSGYVIDASSILHLEGVEASPRFPSYSPSQRDHAWALIEQAVGRGNLTTLKIAAEEVERHCPAGYEKLAAIPGFVIPRANGLVPHVAEVMRQFPDFVDEDLDYDAADPWIVGLAIKERLTVITNEFPTSFRRRTGAPRIPDVCNAFDLECVDLHQFLTALGLPYP